MKKSFLISVMNGILCILPPLLFSAVLSVLHLMLERISAADASSVSRFLRDLPVLGIGIWLVWLVSFIIAVRWKSGGTAFCIAGLLFASCVFFGLSFAAGYGIFAFPAGLQALFTMFGAPYAVLASGLQFWIPEDGTAAMLACTVYLVLVIISAGYAAIRFGGVTKQKKGITRRDAP